MWEYKESIFEDISILYKDGTQIFYDGLSYSEIRRLFLKKDNPAVKVYQDESCEIHGISELSVRESLIFEESDFIE